MLLFDDLFLDEDDDLSLLLPDERLTLPDELLLFDDVLRTADELLLRFEDERFTVEVVRVLLAACWLKMVRP